MFHFGRIVKGSVRIFLTLQRTFKNATSSERACCNNMVSHISSKLTLNWHSCRIQTNVSTNLANSMALYQ